MPGKFKIRKGDRVIVITGREKGKTGEVMEVMRGEGRVLVQGINMVTKHMRPSQSDPGGMRQIEAPLHISNIAHVDPEDSAKPTRIGYAIEKDGTRKRIARRSGKPVPEPRIGKGR